MNLKTSQLPVTLRDKTFAHSLKGDGQKLPELGLLPVFDRLLKLMEILAADLTHL